jgi:hypothetical protein
MHPSDLTIGLQILYLCLTGAGEGANEKEQAGPRLREVIQLRAYQT